MKTSWSSLQCRLLIAMTFLGLGFCGAKSAVAANYLENVVEPQLEGVPVIDPDAKDNPTLYNFTFRNIEIHPFGGARFGYDSNIYLTDSNRIDDPFFEVAPGLLVRTSPSDTENFSMRWLSNFDGRFFVNESKANTIQFGSWLDSTVKANGWNANVLAGGGRFEDPLNATFADKTPRAIGEARLTAQLTQWEKVVLEAGYHFTYIDYHTDKFASLDRTENEIPVRAVYKYTDSTAFYIKSAWKLCEFRNPGLNNFYIVDSRVGLAKDFTDRSLNFDVNIGVAVARIKNDNGMNPSVRATHIVWDSAFSYQPNEQLAFVAAAYGTPRVNLAVTQPIRPVYGARLDITAKLLERKLKVSVSGNYERIDNLPIDSDQVFMTGNARVQYQFRTWAFGYTAYTLTTRQADGTVLDYVDNKVVVGVGAVL